MKILTLIFTLLITISCQTSNQINFNINNKNINFNILNTNLTNENYHIYLKNLNDNDQSTAYTISELQEISLFPGKYDIYIYALSDKTESSSKIDYYAYFPKYMINQDLKIDVNLKKLTPKYSYNKIKNQIIITVDFEEYHTLFTLSSISIKHKNTRTKSLDSNFDINTYKYTATAIIDELGDYYINISIGLKSSKKDEKSLKDTNMAISTNYFSLLYLGNF